MPSRISPASQLKWRIGWFIAILGMWLKVAAYLWSTRDNKPCHCFHFDLLFVASSKASRKLPRWFERKIGAERIYFDGVFGAVKGSVWNEYGDPVHSCLLARLANEDS